MTTVRLHLSAVLLLALGPIACEDRAVPTEPVLRGPSLVIADAPRGFTPGFYWLPPLVTASALGGGTFDPALSPTVEVCELAGAACRRVLATYTMTSGRGAETVRLEGDAYAVNWHTRDFDLSAEARYRISVRAGQGVLLGFADVQPVTPGNQRRGVDPDDAIALVVGRTLPIKFRVESGIVGQVVVSPANASILTGGTLQYTASLKDLHGAPLSGPAVAWSSASPGVATISANGLATGISPGTTTIAATSQQVTGTTPLTVETLAAGTLSAGSYQTCWITPTGAGYCWGLNARGQLGDGTTADHRVPTAVAGGLTLKQIAAGGLLIVSGPGYGASHTCALTTAGAAYCWGANDYGQLGNGTTTDRNAPAPVSGGLTFREIYAGASRTCALTVTGSAYCWGMNGDGGLGDGSQETFRPEPVAVVGGLTFQQLATGDATCGLTPAGKAYCWGFNGHGNVGDGAVTWRVAPTPVAGGLTFKQLSAGRVSCGLTPQGAAYCWGDNFAGSVGDGTTVDRLVPTAVVGGVVFKQLSVGDRTCGLSVSGAAYCWGWSPDGQVPVAVGGGLTFRHLTVGSNGSHMCALTQPGAAYCWGHNVQGQLGDGTTEYRELPTAVLGGLTFR